MMKMNLIKINQAVDYYQNKIESYKRQMNKNEELIKKKTNNFKFINFTIKWYIN